MMTEDRPQQQEQTAIAPTTVLTLHGRRAAVDVMLILPSALDYINYQIKAMTPGAIGSVAGESFGEQAAAEWLIQKSYRVINTDVLDQLGIEPPLPPSLADPQPQGFGEKLEEEETPPESSPVGRSLTPGLLEALQVEADEYGALLRMLIGVEGDVTFNDLDDEAIEQGRGIGDSNDFTHEGKRVKRLYINWTETLKIQKALIRKPKQTYIELFTKYFTVNDQPITYEMLKDANPHTGLGIKTGILIFLRLGRFLNKS